MQCVIDFTCFDELYVSANDRPVPPH